MREILFRGKRVDSGELVYGWLCRVGDKYANIVEKDTEVLYSVSTKTIGQYTGLIDKNGRKIFEGDIVDCLEFYGEVYYDPEGCFDLRDNTPEMCGGFIGDYNSLEVVGNIYDNPELLEVTE